MAVWFGHTQTLTSISKSVSTVASGILGLEDNLATFMKKVIYYDKFFQRTRANLPKEVASTAAKLFARCYEYRDEIRDELESSLAYVADAGRWVVGMEDWNSKMDKRVHQISELVLLANSLLVEYAMTGKVGGEGSKDELDAYLRTVAASVVLKNQTKQAPTKPTLSQTPSPASSSPSAVQVKAKSRAVDESCVTGSTESLLPTALTTDDSSSDYEQPQLPLNGTLDGSTLADGDRNSADKDDKGDTDDNDAFNPFAANYQSRADPYSLDSSLASLANESSSLSSVFDTASCDADDQCAGSQDGSSGAEPLDSPVDLREYECLDMASIPNYDAFKPSFRSRVRRMNAAAAADVRLSQSLGGLAVSTATRSEDAGSEIAYAETETSSVALHHSTPSILTAERTQRWDGPTSRPSRLMDMNYSYDFQREQECNPFVSPPSAQLQVAGFASISELDLDSVAEPRDESLVESDGEREGRDDTYDTGSGSELLTGDGPTRRSDEDETNALLAALAAASEDDYDLFGAAQVR